MAQLGVLGVRALGVGGDDETAHVGRLATRLGIVDDQGSAEPVRRAQLLLVLDILAAIPEPAPVSALAGWIGQLVAGPAPVVK